MRAALLSAAFALVASFVLAAEPHFPALTGRVVDEAHILSDETKASLSRMLEEYENGTTNQVVVVTVPSLEGYPIEDYGYQLGRSWGIGQKDKNNGVLLLVAPKDRAVRIEVGYGLEPVLTDAASSQIVQGIILPQFRAGNMEQGIVEGTQAILSVLGGKGVPATASISNASLLTHLMTFLFLGFWLYLWFRHPLMALLLSSQRFGSSGARSGWSRGSSGGSSSGGGFSGGGGSFGGGGASGRW